MVTNMMFGNGFMIHACETSVKEEARPAVSTAAPARKRKST